MKNIYERNGLYYIRFQHEGRDLRRSTGIPVPKGKAAEAEARQRAEAELERIIAETKGSDSVEALFVRLNESIEKLSESEREQKRIVLSERLRSGAKAKLPIALAWQTWLNSPKKRSPSKSTIEMYHAYWGRDAVKKHGKKRESGFKNWLVKNHSGIVFLHQVTNIVAEQYATFLWSSGIAPRTYNGTISFLRSMFSVLSVRAGIVENPWDGLPSVENETESRRELTTDELRVVCRMAEGDLRYWIAIGLYTGLRLGDVVTLKWSEIDFDKLQIRRIPRKTRRKGKAINIPLHPVLESILKELSEDRKSAESDYLFPDAAQQYLEDKPTAISRKIQAHFEGCGIKTTEKPSGRRQKRVVKVGFHSLRHSFVSLCAANKVPRVAIQELVGHGSPAMTDLYAHSDDEQRAKAIGLLPEMFDSEED